MTEEYKGIGFFALGGLRHFSVYIDYQQIISYLDYPNKKTKNLSQQCLQNLSKFNVRYLKERYPMHSPWLQSIIAIKKTTEIYRHGDPLDRFKTKNIERL